MTTTEAIITSQKPVELHADWYPPIPIMPTIEHTLPYPIDALPNTIQNAITTYQQYGQQPLPLVACSALANVSLACQTLANVARDHLLVSPVSLFFLGVLARQRRKPGIWNQNSVLTPFLVCF